MKNSPAPFISVCLPVYETEPLLAQCLSSVFLQDFDSFEVIVVSDASRFHDEAGRSAKKIVKQVHKDCEKIRRKRNLSPVSVTFIEHRENMGLVEVRRSLLYYAKGKYISYVDSDDVMAEGALKAFFEVAQAHDSDIIQGRSIAGFFRPDGSFVPKKKNMYSIITIGEISGEPIIKSWLAGGKVAGVLWAKAMKRSILERAFESIPHIECNMTEDFLIFFFTSFYAQKYVGIDKLVYYYRAASGMSSARKIDSIRKLRMVCSSASVFTVISESEELKSLSETELGYIRRFSTKHLMDNILQLRRSVIPELQEKAHAMLCEYWGAGFVEKVEKIMDSAEN